MDLHWYLYSKRKPVKGSLLKEVSLIKKMFDVKCSFAQQAMTMPAWSMPSTKLLLKTKIWRFLAKIVAQGFQSHLITLP